jgi:hypothetical protein
MQTFIPIASLDFTKSAAVLDNKRLHKQALEAWQILMNLLQVDPDNNPRIPKGWSNHPAVKMWKGHETALYLYIQCMVSEWKHRGYKTTIGVKAHKTYVYNLHKIAPSTDPEWIDSIASSHRMALLTKNYKHYSQFSWPEDTGIAPTEYEYVWPTELSK